MKTKFIPSILFALTIVATITANAMHNNAKPLTSFQGYIKGNPSGTICTSSVWCSDVVGPICMSGLTQIFGKDASGKCVVTLYADTFK